MVEFLRNSRLSAVCCRSGLLLAALACGCAPRGGGTQDQLVALRKDIESIRSVQAEHTAQLNNFEATLQTTAGRVEELDHLLQSRFGEDLSSLRNDLFSLRRRVPPPPIVPALLLDADEIALENFPAEVAGIMRDALAEVREGRFAKAIPLLEEASFRATDKDALPLALFWLGVSNEGMGVKQKALGIYHDAASRFPKHERTKATLLRQASILIILGDSKTARLTLQKLMAQFPKTPEAEQAKKRLADLGK